MMKYLEMNIKSNIINQNRDNIQNLPRTTYLRFYTGIFPIEPVKGGRGAYQTCVGMRRLSCRTTMGRRGRWRACAKNGWGGH